MKPINAWAICDTDGHRRPTFPLLRHIYGDRESALQAREHHGFHAEHYPVKPVMVGVSCHELLSLAEQLLTEYTAERDCLYDSVTVTGCEEDADPDDLAAVHEMDAIIDRARAVIARAKGDTQ